MRGGEPQREQDIRAFVAGVVSGSITRPQAAAWLAWAYRTELGPEETVALTRAMAGSGGTLTWGEGPTLIDKHSTGGVGDKVSLVLAPLWAELGYRVPMVSGRGLGHTGGTLDKLESIPGFRTDLDASELATALDSAGCFISGQTEDLVPADRILYALRNETCTVPSVPLIVASILSKKIAEGTERLVLDVKCGSGAFMTSEEEAGRLARALVDVAKGAGLVCHALVTRMDRPLGHAVGNGLEVAEAVDCLQGGGPGDLSALVLELAGDPRAEEVLASGAAYERFRRMVVAQGGDPDAPLHGGGTDELVISAEHGGIVTRIDALQVGRAVKALGAGRERQGAPIDHGVGLVLMTEVGQPVSPGDPVVRVFHRQGRGLVEARAHLERALVVGEAPEPWPVVLARVD